MKKLITIFAAFMVSSTGSAMTVNWSLQGSNPITGEPTPHRCEYKGVFFDRPASRETDPPIKSLRFKKPDSLPAADHEACQSIISNLTNLDQPRIRDQIAKIISSFPCPNANLEIKSFQQKNETIKIIYPNARSDRGMSSMFINNCLKERPEECIIPSGGDPSFIMTFDALKYGLEQCSAAMNNAVRRGAELAAWQQQNDPNRSSTNTEEHQD